jgi:2-polyprenyl-3-methyl-5-hydroxy-6-metoxy-1,4-benzoquinol methylase
MIKRISPQELTKNVCDRALTFLIRHSKTPYIGKSFGYFTKHPVAPLNHKRLSLLLRIIEEKSSKLNRPLRILDLACGGGVITCAIAEMGHRVLGVDSRAEEIKLARLFSLEEKYNGIFETLDLIHDSGWERTAEEVLGGKPDMIILAYALHHIPQVEFFIDRLSRWVVSGTDLLINEENPLSPSFQVKHFVRKWIQRDTDIEWHKSYLEWKDILERHDFTVEKSSLYGCDVLPEMLKIKPELKWSILFTACRN